jgi:hypothetical protein
LALINSLTSAAFANPLSANLFFNLSIYEEDLTIDDDSKMFYVINPVKLRFVFGNKEIDVSKIIVRMGFSS